MMSPRETLIVIMVIVACVLAVILARPALDAPGLGTHYPHPTTTTTNTT